MFGRDFVGPYRVPEVERPHLMERIEENDLDPDQGNQTLCRVCGLPIFSTPYTKTEEGHFLHRCCAQIPQSLIGHSLHVKPLLLFHEQHNTNTHLNAGDCEACTRACGASFYRCPDDGCEFTLDVLCATTLVKIIHRSHPHELAVFRRTARQFTCGGCGLEHQGDFYWCDLCDFYLHHHCAVLPNTIQHSNHGQHPLCITYVPPEDSFKILKSYACSICQENLLSSIKSGIYFCTTCDYNIHIKCAISEPADYRPVSGQDVVDGLIHLPMPDEHTNLVQCLLGNKGSHVDSSCGATKKGKHALAEKVHSHDLIFHSDDDPSKSSVSSYVCDACIKPISPPFYSCPQCTDFYLHACCATLPLQLQHPLHGMLSANSSCKDKPLALLIREISSISISRSSGFLCDACFKYCSGFCYYCKVCNLSLDVGCALLPDAITYEGHGKSHVLFLSYTFVSRASQACQSCNTRIAQQLFYKCCSCFNFELHVLCVFLPLRVSYKLDRHPLELSFSKFPTPIDDDRDFCEICEEGIGTDCWFYHCKECVTLFHIKCIPCVGQYSLVKFGKAYKVRGHDCPLISIRSLISYSYMCSICHWTIQGKKDGIAFECTKCRFWACLLCAWDNIKTVDVSG